MTKIQKKTEVILDGRGAITLSPHDHIATGGEGSVYKKAKTIVKLYTDTDRMVRDGIVDKIKALAQIDHRYIVAPKDVVLNRHGKPIGFYMPYVDGEALSRVFTNDFRSRENFGDSDASVLVDRMREAVQFAHNKKAVLVDANELNWLVRTNHSSGPEPRVIDVDSWAIGRWQPHVIMPSIRDWHAREFNQLTDWFAWGIVTFQVYTGIHPYKGKLVGYKPNEMERRMKENASVFTTGVRLNRAVRDFTKIPGKLLDWYVHTFQHGKRHVPPSPFDTGAAIARPAQVMRVVTTSTGALVFDKIFGTSDDKVERIYPCGTALCASGAVIELAKGQVISQGKSRACEVVRTTDGWLVVDMVKGDLAFSYINRSSLREEVLSTPVAGHKVIRYENRLFVVTEKGLAEVVVSILGKPILTTAKTWGVMVNATKWFDGVGVQDAMGAMYVIAPFGENACAQVRVRELDGLRPVAGISGHRFVSIIALDKNGDYQKLELSFDREYRSYTVWQGVADVPNLNVTALPKGVCATIVNDGELSIFVPSNGTLNKISDKHITTDMALSHWDNKVVYIKNGAVWQVRMK